MSLPDPIPMHDAPEPELRELQAALDRLARSEALAPGAGLERRLFEASVASLRGAHDAPAPRRVADVPTVLANLSRRLAWRMRLAAGIMLAAGAGVVALSIWGVNWSKTVTVAHAPPAATIDPVATMLAAAESALALVPVEQVDSLAADIDGLAQSLVSDVTDVGWPQTTEPGMSQ